MADINGDGRLDLLFANGGNYTEAGLTEPNLAFLNRGAGQRFENVSATVFGPTPGTTSVIKARDINADGLTDIIVGTPTRLKAGCSIAEFAD